MFKKVLFLFFVFAFSLSACTINGVPISVPVGSIQGSGKIVSELRDVKDFDKVNLKSIGDVTIVEGNQESLEITADENLMEYITTEVVNGTLEIGVSPNKNIDPTRTIEYRLTVKSLSSVTLSGFGNITAEQLSGEDLEVKLTGSGNITLGNLESNKLVLRISGFGDIEAESIHVNKPVLEITGSGNITVKEIESENLEVDISGFGNAELEGKTSDQEVQIVGSGDYIAGELESDTAAVQITGFGDSEIWVNESLDITITGSGDVKYSGSPQITQTITGFGEIVSLGEHQ